jgi:hypothetical protein
MGAGRSITLAPGSAGNTFAPGFTGLSSLNTSFGNFNLNGPYYDQLDPLLNIANLLHPLAALPPPSYQVTSNIAPLALPQGTPFNLNLAATGISPLATLPGNYYLN